MPDPIAIQTARQFLEQMAEAMDFFRAPDDTAYHRKPRPSLWRMLLENAYPIPSGGLPPRLAAAKEKSLCNWLPRACYHNAALLAINHPTRYGYCEGYAIGSLFPVLHAWIWDLRERRIVELTWGENSLPSSPLGYCGIRFRTRYVQNYVIEHETPGFFENPSWVRECCLDPRCLANGVVRGRRGGGKRPPPGPEAPPRSNLALPGGL